jgi:CBS domain containing-hemolysin-like protein
MVFNELGRPPLVGDVIRNGHFEFKVLEVDGNRIQKILSTKVA